MPTLKGRKRTRAATEGRIQAAKRRRLEASLLNTGIQPQIQISVKLDEVTDDGPKTKTGRRQLPFTQLKDNAKRCREAWAMILNLAGNNLLEAEYLMKAVIQQYLPSLHYDLVCAKVIAQNITKVFNMLSDQMQNSCIGSKIAGVLTENEQHMKKHQK